MWKGDVPLFTYSMAMKKESLLTPIFAHSIRRMTETGIINIQKKRHMVPKPNCKPVREKGKPLGMEKFASLFVFYIVGCIVSLTILALEIIFKSWFQQKDVLSMSSTDAISISKEIGTIVKQIDALTQHKAINLHCRRRFTKIRQELINEQDLLNVDL